MRKSLVKFVGIPIFGISTLVSEWSLRRYYDVAAEIDRGGMFSRIGWFEEIGRQVNRVALILGEKLPSSWTPAYCDFTIWHREIMIFVQLLILSTSLAVALGGALAVEGIRRGSRI